MLQAGVASMPKQLKEFADIIDDLSNY